MSYAASSIRPEMTVSTAIILAGGLGTRLRSAVPDLPKPMAPIEGRPFLEYQLDYWIAQGIRRFILAVGYRHEAIIDHFGRSYRGAKLDYVVEASPQGTGGGLLLAFQILADDQPFLLLNGDTYFAVELAALDHFAQSNDCDWCFSLFRTRELSRYMGMSLSPSGKVTALKSVSDGAECLANGGVYWVHPRALRDSVGGGLPISLENDFFPLAFDAGRHLFGLEFTGNFIDIGIPGDYYRASAVLTA